MGGARTEPGRLVVLITGATGFVGRHVAEACVGVGWRVRAAIRSAGDATRLPSGVEPVVTGDLGDSTDWVDALDGVDVVVHAAAHVHVLRPRPDDEASFHRVNVIGTRRLAAAAAEGGVSRMVYLSSIGVLGRQTAAGRIFRAGDTPAPHDPYTRSKLGGELAMIDALRGSATAWVIVRPPLVFGPGAPGNFPRLVALARCGLPLPFAEVDNRRSILSVFNLADFVRHVCRHPLAVARVWLVAETEPVSTPGLLRSIAAVRGRRVRLFRCPRRLLRFAGGLLGRQPEMSRLLESLVVDSAEAGSILGWVPPLDLDAALRRSIGPAGWRDRIP